MRRITWTLIVAIASIVLSSDPFTPPLAAQEPPSPTPPTETPSEIPTATFTEVPTTTPTEAPTLAHPTETPFPSNTPSETPTEQATQTSSTTPTAAATPEITPETTSEATAEVTAEVTVESTVEVTELPTAAGTPLPPEPELRPILADDFEAGYRGDWLRGEGWSFTDVGGERGLQLLNSVAPAVLQWGDLLNVAVSIRFQLHAGAFRLNVRQSAAGAYTAVLDSGGVLRLYRGGQEMAAAFVGATPTGQWRTLRLSAMENVVRVTLDNVEVIGSPDASPLPPGAITLSGEGSSAFWIGEYSLWRPLTELQAETTPLLSAAPEALFAQESSSGSRIVFESTRAGDLEIFMLDPEACTLGQDCPATQLTNNGVADIDPALSKDGSQIAYASLADGDYEIYVINADGSSPCGSSPCQLTFNSANDSDPAWSSDGSQIAFASNRDGDYEIYVINANGSGPCGGNPCQLTTNTATDIHPNWRGSQIAFASSASGLGTEIWVMNADATGSGKVKYTSSASIDEQPAWSPDGIWIAFVSNRYGNLDNYDVVKLNYSQCTAPPNCTVTRLTTHVALDYHPTWSPDGTEIAFTSERTGNKIWVMNADGTSQVQITFVAGTDRNPNWGQSGMTRREEISMELAQYRVVVLNIEDELDWPEPTLEEILAGVNLTARALAEYSYTHSLVDERSVPYVVFNRVMFDNDQPPGNNRVIQFSAVAQTYPVCSTNKDIYLVTQSADFQAQIDCDPRVMSQGLLTRYAVIHELGHVFVGRTGGDIVTNTLPHYAGNDTFYHFMDAAVEFDRFLPGQKRFVFGRNQLGNNELDWERSNSAYDYGWGSAALLPAPCENPTTLPGTPFPFQQHPCDLDDRQFPTTSLITEREEGAADMYLNWMYRLLPDTGPNFNGVILDGFLNRQWRGSLNNVQCYPNGCDDQGRSTGDVRSDWTSCAMAVLFNQYSLWPSGFGGIPLTDRGDGSKQVVGLGCRHIPIEHRVALDN